ALPGDHPLPAAFAQTDKDRVEQFILTIVSHARALGPAVIGRIGDPFEVTVVAAGKDDGFPRLRFLLPEIEIYHVDVARIIFPRQARTPEKVDHRSGG